MSIATALTALADDVSAAKAAITAKGGTAPNGTADMAQAIADLPSGGAPVINPLSVTENGTYNAPSGVDGYSPVTVNVPQGITPTGTIEITENGTHDVTAFASALVNVQGGGSLPTSISKLDGGSFTPASDTLIGNYTVSHNLGEAPKGVAIFSDNAGGSYSVETVSWACKVNNAQAFDVFVDIYTTGSAGTRIQAITEGSLAATEWYFRRNNTYYKAGTTYKWLAWA